MEQIQKYSFPIAIVVILIGILYILFKPAESVVHSTPQPEAKQSSSQTDAYNSKQMEKPTMQIDQSKQYSAVLHTEKGDITIQFDTKNTPITSNNFISLAKAHFYDNVVFHRTIPGFMIQGGDPEGTGAGGPGYKFEDEYLKGEYKRGTVAMANAGPNTNGSQFFIMHADYPLPNAYVIFAQVTNGLDVVDAIATAEATISMGGEKSKPVTPVKITSIDIVEK